MKELFVAINAKYPHTNLAVRVLINEINKTKLPCSFIEHTINSPVQTIIDDILKQDADIVSFSCYIWNINSILAIAKAIKQANPQTKILFGGPEVSFDGENLLAKYEYVDYIIVGDGELPHVQFAEFLLGNKSINAVSSLVYRIDDVIKTNPSQQSDHFANASFPYLDLAGLTSRVIYYEASRGCPFACTFCLSSESERYQEKPLAIVKRDVKTFIDANVKIVKFVDRTFNTNKARAIDLLEYIMANSINTCFHLELAPTLLSDALLDCLAQAKPGIFQLELGIQSTHLPTLEAINRIEDFASFAPKIRRIIAKENMHVHVDLIAGLPYEGLEEFKLSFNSVFSLYADNLQLGFLKLLKGSPLRAQANAFGIVHQQNAPYEVISTPWISKSELAYLQELEYILKRIYNSGLYRYTVIMLSQFLGSSFAVFEDLLTFIKQDGATIKKCSEQDLIDLLWRYCGQNGYSLAQEMLLFECLNKRKRPNLPDYIVTDTRLAFRDRYFFDREISREVSKKRFPVRFNFDVLQFISTLETHAIPTVVMFDYANFEQGVSITKG